MRFQTRKWDVELTWEQMTLTPLGTTTSGTSADQKTGIVQPDHRNFFLFELIEQVFAPNQKQEQLSQ
jgi:hypothetical protein